MVKSFTANRLTNSSDPAELDAYNQFVDLSPQGIMYCHTWWLEGIAPGQWQVLLLQRGDAIKAAWPLVIHEKQNGSRIGMPPLTQKLGILFAPSQAKYAEGLSEEHRLIDELINLLPDGMPFMQSFHENFTNWLPLHWRGYQQTTRYTYLLDDLSDRDRLWQNMREARRRAIRKAQKEKIQVRQTEDVEKFVTISSKTFQRQGFQNPFSLEHVDRLDRCATAHAGRRMTIAEDSQGRIHACDYLIYDQQCAVSLLGGADPDLRASGAQVLLEWESIMFSSDVSAKFDFEGSMVPGIEHFMRGFGARQTPYFRIWKDSTSQPKTVPSSKVQRFVGRALRKLARMVDPA